MATLRRAQPVSKTIQVSYELFRNGYLDFASLFSTACFILVSIIRLSHRLRVFCEVNYDNGTRLACVPKDVVDLNAYFFNHLYQAIFFLAMALVLYHVVMKFKHVSLKVEIGHRIPDSFIIGRWYMSEVWKLKRNLEKKEKYFQLFTTLHLLILVSFLMTSVLMESVKITDGDSSPKNFLFLTREIINKINIDSSLDMLNDILIISIINVLFGVAYCSLVILQYIFVSYVMKRDFEELKVRLEKVGLEYEMQLRDEDMKNWQADSERVEKMALELYNLYIAPAQAV